MAKLKARMKTESDRSSSGSFDDEKGSFDSYGRRTSTRTDSEYPTFTGNTLMDPESQILKLTKGVRGQGTWDNEEEVPLSAIDEESDDEIEELDSKNTAHSHRQLPHQHSMPPQIQAPDMSGIPPQLQGMVTNVQPRFAPGIPTINLMPSTPSTIASSKRSARFPRPDSVFSANSSSTVSSSSGSTQTKRMDMMNKAASVFPTPPERVAMAQGKAKPKSHLMNPHPLDQSRLMPPKKLSTRKRGGSQSMDVQVLSDGRGEWARPSSRRSFSLSNTDPQDVGFQSTAEPNNQSVPVRPVSAMKMATSLLSAPAVEGTPRQPYQSTQRRSVRFDLARHSNGSLGSISSGEESDLGLSELLPKKRLSLGRALH